MKRRSSRLNRNSGGSLSYEALGVWAVLYDAEQLPGNRKPDYCIVPCSIVAMLKEPPGRKAGAVVGDWGELKLPYNLIAKIKPPEEREAGIPFLTWRDVILWGIVENRQEAGGGPVLASYETLAGWLHASAEGLADALRNLERIGALKIEAEMPEHTGVITFTVIWLDEPASPPWLEGEEGGAW